VGLRSLALLIPPIRRLYEERARLLQARLHEERTRFTAKLREERTLAAQVHEERTQLRDQRTRLTAQLHEERAWHRAQQPMGWLLALLDQCGIDLVLDVGANEGQYVGRIAMLQLELAWQPGYEGQAELGEMLEASSRCSLCPPGSTGPASSARSTWSLSAPRRGRAYDLCNCRP
jgi:hypothetical protein